MKKKEEREKSKKYKSFGRKNQASQEKWCMGLKNKKKFRILHGKFDDLASLQEENKKRSEGVGAKKHKKKKKAKEASAMLKKKQKV